MFAWQIFLLVLAVLVLVAVVIALFFVFYPCPGGSWGPCKEGRQTKKCPCRRCEVRACKEDEEGKDAPWLATKGYMNFINDTDTGIRVFLDPTYPPCQRIRKDRCSWSDNDVTETYIVQDNKKMPTVMAQFKDLEPGQIWAIKIPIDDKGMPAWCSGSICPGTGGWVTRKGIDMPAPEHVMRFEMNFNSSSLWYNLSGVDGINANMIMQYTGCPETKCLVDLHDESPEHPNGCPWPSKAFGANVCSAPKFPPGCDPKKMITYGEGETKETKSECDWAGCGYADEKTKCLCHYFWKTNPNAIRWNNYLRHNPSGECDMYSWAYGEKELKPDTSVDCCRDVKNCCDHPRSDPRTRCCLTSTDPRCCQINDCVRDTPRGPLGACPLKPHDFGVLNIWITKIK